MSTGNVFEALAERASQTWTRLMPGMQSGAARARQASRGEERTYPLEICNWIVFGHVWNRPELSTRERRILTIAIIASVAGAGPLHTHVR
jgi:alkylhydroperoxidase/carboxymuconolactone decarboxylase family protein YurZ